MKKSILAVSLAATLTLSGCASTNGQGGMTNSQKGALIGAISGAVLGKSTANHDSKRAVIGGILGGIAGAAIGDYMDKQEAALRKELENTNIGVTREGDNISLNFPDKITFAVGKSDLKSNLLPVLNDIAGVLGEYNQTLVNIHGHTDSTGSEAYNQTLSEQRAQSVMRYLGGQGVNQQRLLAWGYGETTPVADNNTAAGRAENRRVEIILQPVEKQL